MKRTSLRVDTTAKENPSPCPLPSGKKMKGRGYFQVKKIACAVMCVYLFLCHGVRVQEAHAVCAQASIQIAQDLALERIAFDARLVITNSIPDKSLQNIRVDVFMKDQSGTLKNELFFLKVSSLTNIASVDGNGLVAVGDARRAVEHRVEHFVEGEQPFVAAAFVKMRCDLLVDELT